MDQGNSDGLTIEQIKALSPREFEIYKLSQKGVSEYQWEVWREERARDAAAVNSYENEFNRLDEQRMRLFTLLLTTLMVSCGGGITALLAVFGSSLINGDRIASPFGEILALLAGAMASAFIGGVFTYYSYSAYIDAQHLTAERIRRHTHDDAQLNRADDFGLAAAAFSWIAAICFVSALLTAARIAFRGTAI